VTADELKTHLQTLDWSQAALARRLGVAPNTVYRWAAGLLPAPAWLAGYLDMAATVRRCVTRQAMMSHHDVPLAMYELADRIGIGYAAQFKEAQRAYEAPLRREARKAFEKEWGVEDDYAP